MSGRQEVEAGLDLLEALELGLPIATGDGETAGELRADERPASRRPRLRVLTTTWWLAPVALFGVSALCAARAHRRLSQPSSTTFRTI